MHFGKHSCNIGCISQTRIKGILKTKGVEVELELLGLQGMGQQNDGRINLMFDVGFIRICRVARGRRGTRRRPSPADMFGDRSVGKHC